jgi:hypothetical protein
MAMFLTMRSNTRMSDQLAPSIGQSDCSIYFLTRARARFPFMFPRAELQSALSSSTERT